MADTTSSHPSTNTWRRSTDTFGSGSKPRQVFAETLPDAEK